MASWHLSRHPIDATTSTAFIEGARNDVIIEGKERSSTFSMDPNHVIGRRIHKPDAAFFSRDINYKVIEHYDPMNIY